MVFFYVINFKVYVIIIRTNFNMGDFTMEITNINTSKIFKMSIPIFMELLLQLLVGNVDQFMISQYSQNSVAAIGNGNQIINIVIMVLNAMSIATTILITQYLGSNDKKRIYTIINLSIIVISFFSVAITLFILLIRKKIFIWLQVPEIIIDEAISYIVIVGSFIIVQGIYMTFTAILKSYSLVKEVMIISIIMNTVNIIGNAILINGRLGFPALGIVGAAISTNIGKCVGLILIILVYKQRINIKISFEILRNFPTYMLKKLLFIALPSGGEAFSYNLSQICILKFINLFGTVVIATKVYCSMLANVAYVYSIAISQATQIIIGYLIGSNKTEQIVKRVYQAIFISLVASVTLTIFMYINSDFIFGIFTSDTAVFELGKKILLVEIVLEIGRSVNIAMTKCLVAVGDVNFPVIMCMFSAWIIAVGLGYYFGVILNYGLVGIWIAMAIDEVLRAVIFLIRFSMGKWKLNL